MQRTITEQAAPKAGQAEPEVLQRMRTDPRICSIVIVRAPNPSNVIGTHVLVKTSRITFPTPDTSSFLVTDLLEDISYMVGQEGSFCKLVFTLNDEQVVVIVQPGSDLTEIAHDFVIHLATIAAHN
ncbi:MAG: hypothetical protein ABSF00_13465 [Candidatus Bathyarchaeia archaeon]